MATSMMQAKSEGAGTYTYSSQPHAAPQDQKYRDKAPYGNIMYDHRIIRGNTYALHTLPASSQPDPLEIQRQQESRRRTLARRRARDTLRSRSPPPVDGRKHTEVQTELYLEEITDRVEETEIGTQTDAFLDRPPTPLFVPAKTGLDVATQIEEGDLFDFDLEVQPMLEVLIGKTVEQALLEVMEEEELASLRAQQRVFEENRNAEMVEMQRLEEQERRRREEKERRMQQQRQALMKEKETAEKVAARAFAQSYLADLMPSVFSNLNNGGFFYDPVEREVETVFLPWLMDETEKALDHAVLARALLDSLIREVVMRKLGIDPPSPPPINPPTLTEAPPTITEAPPTMNEAPPTTTKAPPTTTEAPPTTTEAPPTTTEAPPTTSEAPPTTTKTPPTTTEALPTTTEAPPTTTEAPPTTTEALPTTTEASPTTTEAPPTTTEAPPNTTEAPPTITEAPPTTTEAPPTTTETPPTTTEAPPNTTEAPPTTTEAPPTTTETPPTTTEASPTTTEAPPTTTEAPPTTTEAPPTTTEAPPTTTEAPPTTTEAPPTTTETLPTTTVQESTQLEGSKDREGRDSEGRGGEGGDGEGRGGEGGDGEGGGGEGGSGEGRPEGGEDVPEQPVTEEQEGGGGGKGGESQRSEDPGTGADQAPK